VDVESIHGEKEVWSCHARVTVCKSHNFWSDRVISIVILQDFEEALFHIVDMESILGEEEV
jgi:hypothetical protein